MLIGKVTIAHTIDDETSEPRVEIEVDGDMLDVTTLGILDMAHDAILRGEHHAED